MAVRWKGLLRLSFSMGAMVTLNGFSLTGMILLAAGESLQLQPATRQIAEQSIVQINIFAEFFP